jgi:hypothetical protein
MSQVMRRWWFLAATLLAIASVAALALLASAEVIPSVVRDPLLGFVHPGTTVWWLVLGGPFRSVPSSPAGIAFAATTNTALWLLVPWLAMVIGRAIRRMLAAKRS